jgi:FkbM family methyltransferase
MVFNFCMKLISLTPPGVKKFVRRKELSLIFGIYVNLRELLRNPENFGQVQEDKELRKWLPESDGTYIDVGAGYPVRGSNTYFLYKRKGFKGTCIEPIKNNCTLHRLFRPKDLIINALAGTNPGNQFFYEFNLYEYSTVDDARAQEVLSIAGTRLVRKSILTEIKLSDLRIPMTPRDATLISIDCEGADLEVLYSNDWEVTRPRVICVEEMNTPIDDESSITSFLTKLGYRLECVLSPSLIFVAEEFQLTPYQGQ